MQTLEHIKNPRYPCHICQSLTAMNRVEVILEAWATISFGICYACHAMDESEIVEIIRQRQYTATPES